MMWELRQEQSEASSVADVCPSNPTGTGLPRAVHCEVRFRFTSMLGRREFLAGAASALAARAAGYPSGLILISAAEANRMRRAAQGEDAALFEKFAASALRAGPWSVTEHRPSGIGVNAGAHDYVSEGPYWWPDPKNPSGPYIRKDGERNPDRFMGNRSDLGNLCTAVLALGMGAYFLGKAGCADHAGLILRTWFLDTETRMNPNLEHGQMIRGINTGRGTGIIDTVSLIHVVQGIALLEQAGGFDSAVSSGMRQWFRDYTKWLTTSEKGLAEKRSGNNHATWWTAQVACYAAFTGDSGMRRMAWEHYRTYLVPSEIRPDGSCPREEARTQSLSYSSMNLDAFSLICRSAGLDGVDLWHYRTAAGIGVEKSFLYLVPYMLHPETWKKQQISKYSPAGHYFPGLAGIGLGSEALLSAYRAMARAESPFVRFLDLLIRTAA